MPQIDLAIINLTVFSVFSVFTISFLFNIFFKPLALNKGFLFFNTFAKKSTKNVSVPVLKKLFLN